MLVHSVVIGIALYAVMVFLFEAVSRGGGESQHSHRVCRAHLHDRVWARPPRTHELAAIIIMRNISK
jgi:hypothetical protein